MRLLKVGECSLGQIVMGTGLYGQVEFYKIVGFTRSNAPKVSRLRKKIVKRLGWAVHEVPDFDKQPYDQVYITRVFKPRRPYSPAALAIMEGTLRVHGRDLRKWNGEPYPVQMRYD